MVFITAGMGGGTGTGAAPVVAQLAKELGILTVAVVTKPFPFEGRRRMQVALKGIEDLSQHVDSLITVPNEKLLTVLGRDVTLLSAFKSANDVLLGAVQGIADLITRPGLINVDFADVRTVMSEMGMAMMGSGTARGDDRAVAAAEAAINNPLLEDVNLSGACGILVNVTAGPNLTMREFDEIGQVVHQFASEDATVVVGTALDAEMQDDVRVTVVATGLNRAAGRQTRAARGGRSSVAAAADRGAHRHRQRADDGLRRSRCAPTAARGHAAEAGQERHAGAGDRRSTIWIFRPSCGARPTEATSAICARLQSAYARRRSCATLAFRQAARCDVARARAAHFPARSPHAAARHVAYLKQQLSGSYIALLLSPFTLCYDSARFACSCPQGK